jgi:hypothetical protein
VLLGAIGVQQISRREILLGDQDQNMLARKLLGAIISQRKRVIFRKRWIRRQARVVIEGRPLLHRLLGYRLIDVEIG